MSTVAVTAIQTDPVWEDVAANLTDAAVRVAAAADRGARLVVLPELFATGFTMATERTAETIDGPTAALMRETAERHQVWLCGSAPIISEGNDRPANTALVIDPAGDIVAQYSKRHLFAYAGEDAAYRPGDRMVTIDVDGVEVTPTICFDLRFPEDYRSVAADTDAFLVIASWPAVRRNHWRSLLVARAIECQAYVVGVNRVGVDGNGLDHAGDSMIVDPLGEIVTEAERSPTTLSATLDSDVVSQVRRDLPFLPSQPTS